MKKQWLEWEESIHTSPEQVRKQTRAVTSDCKPFEIDFDNLCGSFVGGKSGEIYSTNLKTCSCMSCIREKLPCKHMYRLAYELDLLSPPSPLLYGFSKEEALGLFNQLSEEAGYLFVYKIGDSEKWTRVHDPVIFEEMHSLGLVEYCTDLDIRLNSYLSSLTKVELFDLTSSIPDSPKKSMKKQVFIDFVLNNDDLVNELVSSSMVTDLARISPNVNGLFNSLKHAYHRKHPA